MQYVSEDITYQIKSKNMQYICVIGTYFQIWLHIPTCSEMNDSDSMPSVDEEDNPWEWSVYNFTNLSIFWLNKFGRPVLDFSAFRTTTGTRQESAI